MLLEIAYKVLDDAVASGMAAVVRGQDTEVPASGRGARGGSMEGAAGRDRKRQTASRSVQRRLFSSYGFQQVQAECGQT